MNRREPFDRLIDKCVWVGDCLIWTGSRKGTSQKYGQFRPTHRREDPMVYVHRWVYENTVGQVPDGYEVDHVKERGCTSTVCVNPEHLEPVTKAENMKRARLTVCRAGTHDLTLPENQNWDTKGRRRGCKGCIREREARRVRHVV